MASAQSINIEQLCLPISEDQPAGPYWRDDDKCSNELFPRVDSALVSARKNERKKAESTYFAGNEARPDLSNYAEPDWHEVIEAAQVMMAHSKDLWVAAWLTEALAREYGFPGLRDGFILIRRLCELYWDSIHPRPDDVDGIRKTTAQLSGDLFAELVTLMPITKDGLATADYDKSAEMDGLKSESDRQEYRSLGVISVAEFNARVRDSGPEYLQNLLEDIQEAFDAFKAYAECLDERCGHDAPAVSQATVNFEQTIDLIHDLAAEYLPKSEAPQSSEEQQAGDAGTVSVSQTERQTGWNRDVAFAQILQTADLFAKYEPNSPVASMLRQAVHIGKMSWGDMIKSFLSTEDAAFKEILKQTGGTSQTQDAD